MTIKEQSEELAIYETAGSKQTSGMRKVLEKFPFLKNFGSEDQKMNAESVMTEETSKPEFLDNGLPSYNEATKEDKENKIDQHEDSVIKEVPFEELVNVYAPAGTQNEDISEEISSEQMEIIENETKQSTSEVEDETKETGETRPKEKKSQFRFPMFRNEK